MAKKKITTIEGLATTAQNEFLNIGKRFDTLEEKVDTGFKALVDTLDLMRQDIRDIKMALGPMTRIVADLENSVRSLDKRVSRIEEKVK
jgi:hypothetical protein